MWRVSDNWRTSLFSNCQGLRKSQFLFILTAGRSQSTDRSKENNTVYNMGKSEPIRYTMEELRLIKRKVENNNRGGHGHGLWNFDSI